MLLDYLNYWGIPLQLYLVPFCLPKNGPKKGPRNRYTARLREGALITFSSSVASTSVILLFEQKH